ncbi:MAG: 3-deoxy-D-manno-octulosonic acid transferase [Steroidobacteraceae bacterium]
MIRILYPLAMRLLVPAALLNLWWRGRREPGYRQHLSQRFGFGPSASAPGFWIHAVSVGEIQAVTPLVRALRLRYPQTPVTLTTSTAAGAARARALFGAELAVRYLPWDLPGSVRRFFDRVQPQLAIIVEKELWPVLYRECGRRGVPLLLASAALASRSLPRYRRLWPLYRRTALEGLHVAAQSTEDAARFADLGIPAARIHVTGNLKFDTEIGADRLAAGRALRAQWGLGDGFLLVAGSTYEAEEDALLEIRRLLSERGVAVSLVLAPRHAPRFESVAARLQSAGVPFRRRSHSTEPLAGASGGSPVLLLDTLGELTPFYAAAEAAFVGGSLVPDVGGHNLLEPAALGIPILTGPQGFNAPDIVSALVAEGAAQIVTDAVSMAAAIEQLARDPAERRRRGGAGQQFVERNRGTLARTLAIIESIRAAASSRPASR